MDIDTVLLRTVGFFLNTGLFTGLVTMIDMEPSSCPISLHPYF